jgi:hypothetical protein
MAQDAFGPIPRQRYYDTQLLYAADFDREQQYGTALRQLQTRLLFTPGVLAGLGATGGAGGRVQVAPGAAVDDSGRVVLLVDRATLDGTELPASSGGFTLDLTAAQYHGKSWLLTLQFAEQPDPGGAFFTQVPAFALSDGSSAGAGQIPLARLAVSTPPAQEGATAPPTVTIDASVGTTAGLSPSRVPPLDASAVATGTLAVDRIPDIPASKVIGGGQGETPTVWARDLAIWPRGAAIARWVLASGGTGFFVGLLRTDTDRGRSYYALGIGFTESLLSFQSPQLADAGVRTGVYADRTSYSLAREGGEAGENATSLRFVGVDADHGFDLLTPEADLPPAQQGRCAGLVVVGTRPATPSEGPVVIIQEIRDAVSPFSFTAVTSPTARQPAMAALAKELHAEGWIAPEAAPAIVAVQPMAPGALLTLLTSAFPESTATAAQAAWALAAAGADPQAASAAVGQAFKGKVSLSDAAAALAGAFPPPPVQEVVVGLQIADATAQEAAPQLKSADAQLDAQPMAMGVLLRLAFPATADTPLGVAKALGAAGYGAGADVTTALRQLFPITDATEIAAAVQEVFGPG